MLTTIKLLVLLCMTAAVTVGGSADMGSPGNAALVAGVTSSFACHKKLVRAAPRPAARLFRRIQLFNKA